MPVFLRRIKMFVYNNVQSILQGISVAVTVWDSDPNNKFIPYDLVDEFVYDYADYPGKAAALISRSGLRKVQPSQ